MTLDLRNLIRKISSPIGQCRADFNLDIHFSALKILVKLFYRIASSNWPKRLVQPESLGSAV